MYWVVAKIKPETSDVLAMVIGCHLELEKAAVVRSRSEERAIVGLANDTEQVRRNAQHDAAAKWIEELSFVRVERTVEVGESYVLAEA